MVALVKMIINQHSNRFNSCPDYTLVLVEFQKAQTELKTIYLIDIEVSDSLERQAT
jgi:hypothetical protein